jgi:hypothetical protein
MRRHQHPVIASGLVLAMALALPAFAVKKTKFKAKPYVEDVTASGIVSAAWVTHQGLGDAGKSDHALVLKKEGPTATVASAGAAISKVKDLTLTELGFDVQQNTHCTASSPQYNVTLADGSVFTFGCLDGTVVGTVADSRGALWNRVRFDNTDAVAAGGLTTTWPGFGVAQVSAVHVLLDEGNDTVAAGAGLVRLDNLDVNGKLIGKPGNSKN